MAHVGGGVSIPVVTWFLVASTIFDSHQTVYEPDKRFSSLAECRFEAAKINIRWHIEGEIGFATCKPDGLEEFP